MKTELSHPRTLVRHSRFLSRCLGCVVLLVIVFNPAAFSAPAGVLSNAVVSDTSLISLFDSEVRPRLQLPADESLAYSLRLQQALQAAQVQIDSPQIVVLIDRSQKVQAALIFMGSTWQGWRLIGATPVSTGLPGQFDHFITPLGVFDHSLDNPDFRAEGTKNEQGFRGYGIKGMRVFDFGWVQAERGWGKGGLSEMRLQMHATDPDLAEGLLGLARSKGCVRIPATLNSFIDRYGLLDEAYIKRAAEGGNFWVLRKDQAPTAFSGRYLVVVDSERATRPDWSPQPPKRVR